MQTTIDGRVWSRTPKRAAGVHLAGALVLKAKLRTLDGNVIPAGSIVRPLRGGIRDGRLEQVISVEREREARR